jgi:hypothetical protein
VSAIPLADARSLRLPAQRTLAVRTVLAVAAVAALVAFLLVSRHPNTRTIVPLPSHADAILVLDLSASISSDTYSRIGGTLSTFARGGGRFGLVEFSDEAYEALPPGTPAADLAPFVRYFTVPPQKQPGFAPAFPANPWQTTFTGGTRISAGMQLAQELALSGGGRPATVVLISDLDDDPGDLSKLEDVLITFRRDHVPVRVVGLNPSPNDVLFFQKLLPPNAAIVEAPTLAQAAPHQQTPFPWTLVALGLVAASAVALRLAWSPRLEWSVP